MITRLSTIWVCIVITFLWGCASRRVAVPEQFWDEKDSRIAIVLNEMPEEGWFSLKTIAGALPYLIGRAFMTDDTEYVKSIKADRFIDIKEAFRSELEAMGFDVVVLDEQVEAERLPESSSKGKNSYKYDLSELFRQTQSERIILLQLKEYGAVTGSYASYGPTATARGRVRVRGVMVSKNGNQVLWDTGESAGEILDPVLGRWQQPPDYPNLTDAVYRAIEKSKIFLIEDFFGERAGAHAVSQYEQTVADLSVPRGAHEIVVKYTKNMETASGITANCHKPYRLSQDCSFWSGAARKVSINGVRLKVAGSEDGAVILVMGIGLWKGHITEKTNSAFVAVVELLEDNDIQIEKVVGLLVAGERYAYYLELDRDAYSLLKAYTVK